ncbi:hypothetical protein Bca4012_012087 [Brassica carinata]
MQDFSHSTESFSPSFSFYVSGDGETVETAVRVVRESQSYGDDDTAEFVFETLPLREESLFRFPTTTETKSFEREEGEEDDDVAAVADGVTSKNLFYSGWILDQSLSSPSQSHSSSESEDSEDLSPRRYNCFWSPVRSPARVKSKTSSAPKRRRITDLLRRSHSDGAVSTTNEPKRCRFKDLMRRSHSDGGGSGSLVSPGGNGSPAVRGKNKTTSNKFTTTSTGEVNMRRKTYLPYRQDLIGVFAGMSRLRR